MSGNKILIIRNLRGYSQEYVAKQLGMAQNSYSRLEKDEHHKISKEMMKKIALCLGVSVEDLESPLPVIINFRGIPESGIQETETALVAFLKDQLAKKDEQISRLLELLHKNND